MNPSIHRILLTLTAVLAASASSGGASNDTAQAAQTTSSQTDTAQAAAAQPAPVTDKTAWGQLDSLDRKALENFLTAFPEGTHAGQVKAALGLLQKLDDIRAVKSKPDFVLSPALLGKLWTEWRTSNPEKAAIEYVAVKEQGGVGLLVRNSPEPFSGGKTGGVFGFVIGRLSVPTGDGSMILLRSRNVKFEFFKGFKFQTTGDETLYFGVIANKGLVHLAGSGTITLPNGKTIALK
jgi:hypothetical protein